MTEEVTKWLGDRIAY